MLTFKQEKKRNEEWFRDFAVGKTITEIEHAESAGWPQIILSFSDGSKVVIEGTSDMCGDVSFDYV